MIWYYLLLFVSNLLNGVVTALHIPKITELPFGADAAMTTAFGYINYIVGNELWPLQAPWYAGLVLIQVAIALYILKLFLGSRIR